MMAVSKAVDEVKFRIPRQILETVFTKRSASWKQPVASIDEQILSCVVRPRVLVDCNLVGGTEMFIDLQGLAPNRPNDYTSVYRIPKDRTQGRSIISVLNISFTDPTRVAGHLVIAGQQQTAMLQAGAAMADAHAPIPVTSTAQVQLIGENVVMVRDTVILPANIMLRAVVANDDNMSHLQLKSYRDFARLVELAVKAYIYNEYAIQMDMGELHGGQNLGKFKEIVDGYSDAEELYQTFLTEKWQKISFMNDSETFTRHLRTMIGSMR